MKTTNESKEKQAHTKFEKLYREKLNKIETNSTNQDVTNIKKLCIYMTIHSDYGVK